MQQTFRISKQGTTLVPVIDGVVHRSSFMRLLRGGVGCMKAKSSYGADDVREVAAGYVSVSASKGSAISKM